MTEFNFPALATSTGLDLSIYSNRQKIEIIEWLILNSGVNIVDELPIKHYVYAGIYAREMFIPEGTVLTGKIHLADHICTLSQGDISVMTDDGIKRIKAPYTFIAKCGIKKIGYAHSDCTFTTYHTTDLTDIEEIENELFSNGDISWIDDIMNNKLIEAE